MPVVGASSSSTRARRTRTRRRLQVLVVASSLAALSAVAILAAIPAPTTAMPAADPTTTIPGPVVPLAQFPVQGKCSFTDTYGAPRSGGRFHEGVDIIAKAGQYVYAVNTGTLTKQYIDQPGSLSGNGWRLTTSDGTYYFYAHFSGFPDGLKVGDKVYAGQIIGYVGMTGNAGVTHLHFEIHPGGGDPVNPTASVKAVDACAVTAVANVQTPLVGAPTANLSQAVRSVASGTTATTSAPAGTTTPANTSAPVTTPTTSPATTTSSTLPADGQPDTASGAPANSSWLFIEPVVIFNGSSSNSIVAGVTKHVAVTGAGIASGVSGVLVRVSATVTSPGSIVVHPCNVAAPVATTLFAEAGPMAIMSTPVAVADGEICVTSSTNASLKVTVIGQLGAGGSNPFAVQPVRPLDSRITGRLVANATSTLAPASFGASAITQAVTATFTILNPTAAGTLSIGPCGGAALKAPFVATPIAAFSAIIPVNAAGLCLASTVAVDVVVDVDALWNQDAVTVLPVVTKRVFDSRVGAEVFTAPVTVDVGSLDGGKLKASTAVVNVTVLAGANGGSVFVWNCEKPPAAAVGLAASNKRATFTVVTSLTNGQLCVAANQPLHVVVDLAAAA